MGQVNGIPRLDTRLEQVPINGREGGLSKVSALNG
jgi:hypothetical protein